MASNTPNLSLYMKDPIADGNDFFDVKTMMNDNWEKIDGFAGGMDEVKERLNTISRQDITLQPGVQIINVAKSALFQLSGLTGRMLVNLLGRMGNCENVGLWSSNTTIALDTTNKTSGISSFKLTLGSVPATASVTFLTVPGKKYIAIADVKNGNTSKVAISINGITGAAGNEVTSASAFAPSVVRFAATDYFHILTVTGTGSSGNTFNMDSVRVYEISDTDYAAAATLTPAQAAAKWPYVDSVMPVRNPYAIRYGENLLPSFYEWTNGNLSSGSSVGITGPYAAKLIETTPQGTAGGYLYALVNVARNTTYTLTFPTQTWHAVTVADGQSPVIDWQKGLSRTFNTGNNDVVRVYVSSRTDGPGTYNFSNPMLNIGSTVKPFKPREDFMLALQTDLYADPVTGGNADTVFEKDGQYFKAKKWKGLTMDGNREWVQGEGGATGGVRQVKLVGAAVGAVAGSGIGVKFDGKLLPQGSTGNTADSNAVTAAGDIYFGIPIADSGWADSYGPTPDDIKAYFFGYKAYDANTITPANAQAMTTATWNGTGTKYWVQRVGAPNFTQSVPQQSYAGYTPYQLVYQLATPTVEPIVSEGQLSFVEGDNQVEVGTGIVLRESAEVYTETGTSYGTRININNASFSGYRLLKNRTTRMLAIYKNNALDNRWSKSSGWVTSAGALAQILYAADTDKEQAYSVTYLMSDPSPAVPLTGSCAANEKTLLADLVDSVQQNTARVSVLENKKADKDNPTWITPILLNAWINYGVNDETAGFLKDSQGYVHIKGTIKLGALNVPVFTLPVGYRPKATLRFTINATNKFGAMRIGADGAVIMETGVDGTYVSLQIPPFLAEQ